MCLAKVRIFFRRPSSSEFEHGAGLMWLSPAEPTLSLSFLWIAEFTTHFGEKNRLKICKRSHQTFLFRRMGPDFDSQETGEFYEIGIWNWRLRKKFIYFHRHLNWCIFLFKKFPNKVKFVYGMDGKKHLIRMNGKIEESSSSWVRWETRHLYAKNTSWIDIRRDVHLWGMSRCRWPIFIS